MKTSTINVLILLSSFLLVNACISDDRYEVPKISTEEPQIKANTSIKIIKSMYSTAVVDFNKANNGGELIIEGYVISNDEAGNFFKTLIIQDAPENPTAGIQIDIDATALYAQFKPGQKVYVLLNGLGMDFVNGVFHIGTLEGSSIGRIPASTYSNYILRSTKIEPLIPKLITPSQYSDAYTNTLIQLDNMQLSNSELGLPYANANNTLTVNRNLKNCVDNSTTLLRNSGFADFKNVEFPKLKGSIIAILSKYNTDYQLYIRDTNDVNFTQTRCDPLFEDSFSAGNLDKWTVYNVIGNETWYYNSFGNPNDSATITGFNNGNKVNEDWLITKAIDCKNVSNITLNFQSVKRYAGNDLEVLMSTDYPGGDPNTNGTWTSLPAILDTNTGSWSSWTNSGDINVSAAAGKTLFIAFKYTSTTKTSATFEIDNVIVKGE